MDARRREPRPASWTARILAPVVLVVAVAAVVLVVAGSLNDGGDGGKRPSSEGNGSTSGCSEEARKALKDGYYVVQPEDVEGLSGIADKTCTSVERLTRLNPNLDPQALQVQNCVDLVADGCKKLANSG